LNTEGKPIVSFALANDPFALANDSFALANDPFALANDSYALANDSYALANDSYALANNSFAAIIVEKPQFLNNYNQYIESIPKLGWFWDWLPKKRLSPTLSQPAFSFKFKVAFPKTGEK
jgi:hypothetical protein